MLSTKQTPQKKNRLTESDRTASSMSIRTGKPWYICKKEGQHDLIVSEENMKRFMQNGYKVVSVYYRGKKFKNLYNVNGRLQFVM